MEEAYHCKQNETMLLCLYVLFVCLERNASSKYALCQTFHRQVKTKFLGYEVNNLWNVSAQFTDQPSASTLLLGKVRSQG